MRHSKLTYLLTGLLWMGLGGLLWASGPRVQRHDFHVSITDIHYNASTRSLEIAVKVFTDDLENALEALGAPRLNLGTSMEHPSADTLLQRYFENRLQVKIGGERLQGHFLGKEYEAGATWCYIEIRNVPVPAAMQVSNRILLEHFDDQSNLVHVDVGGEKRSLLLHKGQEQGKVEF